MRSTATRPAPRSIRAGNVSHNSLAPVASAIERASASAGSRHAVPPTSSTAGSPDRNASAMPRTARSPAVSRRGGAFGAAGSPPSPHEMSAGSTSVAT